MIGGGFQALAATVKGTVTRGDVVAAVNKLIVRNNARRRPYPAPLLRQRAWQRAICIARHNRLFPADVLTAVAKHGAYVPGISDEVAA